VSLTNLVPRCSAWACIWSHQPGALDGIGEAGIILHFGGDGELAARLDAGNQHRRQHGAGGVNRGGAAGRTAAQDDDFRVHGGFQNFKTV